MNKVVVRIDFGHPMGSFSLVFGEKFGDSCMVTRSFSFAFTRRFNKLALLSDLWTGISPVGTTLEVSDCFLCA